MTAVPLSVAVNGYRPLIANRLSKLSAQNKIGSRSPTSLLMQEMGLEPTRYCYHKILSLARLPVPTLPHIFDFLSLVSRDFDIISNQTKYVNTYFYFSIFFSFIMHLS